MMASLYHVTLEGVFMLFDYLSYPGGEACDRDPCNFNSRGADSLPESIPMIVRCKHGHGRFDAGMMAPGIQTNPAQRSEEHTSELQSLRHLVCRLLLEKKK